MIRNSNKELYNPPYIKLILLSAQTILSNASFMIPSNENTEWEDED